MTELHQSFIATDYKTHPIRAVQYAMVDLLRKNVSRVHNRVYCPGIKTDAQFPRIVIGVASPSEHRFIGEMWGTEKGRITINNLEVVCWSKNPREADEIADYVQNAILKNRYFVPVDSSKGYFIDSHFTGGSENTLDPALQAFQRTVNIEVWWLSQGTPV